MIGTNSIRISREDQMFGVASSKIGTPGRVFFPPSIIHFPPQAQSLADTYG
jgi:hypothetical protein